MQNPAIYYCSSVESAKIIDVCFTFTLDCNNLHTYVIPHFVCEHTEKQEHFICLQFNIHQNKLTFVFKTHFSTRNTYNYFCESYSVFRVVNNPCTFVITKSNKEVTTLHTFNINTNCPFKKIQSILYCTLVFISHFVRLLFWLSVSEHVVAKTSTQTNIKPILVNKNTEIIKLRNSCELRYSRNCN